MPSAFPNTSDAAVLIEPLAWLAAVDACVRSRVLDRLAQRTGRAEMLLDIRHELSERIADCDDVCERNTIVHVTNADSAFVDSFDAASAASASLVVEDN